MLSRVGFVEAMLAGTSAAMTMTTPLAMSVTCNKDLPYSCQNTTAIADTCCFIAPGGDILLTQFWDTNPSTGPADSWTIHGLWPDNCDGTYEQYCDQNRQYTNITAILAEKAPCTLKTMQKYWKDYQGDDEDFWEHEFGKHGTCISTLDPECYPGYQPTDEVADYFMRAVSLFKTLPTYDWLAGAGIVPSTTKTYTLAEIQAVLSSHRNGHEAVVRCSGSELNEMWYHFNVRGSVQHGKFLAVDPVGSPSTCPETGIQYLPKYQTPTPTSSTGSPTPTSTTLPTGTPGALSGKAHVAVQPDGFMISGGNWYRAGGTPATYTAAPDSDTTFTLKTSKGYCTVADDSSLSCADGNEPSSFGYDGTFITYSDSSAFYAASAPQGQDKGIVYTTEQAVPIKLVWGGI